MKTQIKTLALAFATVLTLGINTANAINLTKQPIKVNNKNTYLPVKIVVSGNVEVTLVQSNNDKPRFENVGTENVVVKQTSNGIFISPQSGQPDAKLIVYVKDIFRIDATDGAVIKTDKQFKTKYLQIFLKENAKADINAITDETYTVIKDKSTLALKGATQRHIMAVDKKCCMTMDQFVATVTEVNSLPTGRELALLK